MKISLHAFSLLSAGVLFSACGAADPSSTENQATEAVTASVDATEATPPNCSAKDVSIQVATDKANYQPGDSVNITSTITNTSTQTCNLGVGPDDGVAPLVSVWDSSRDQVWSNCFVKDQTGGCITSYTFQKLQPGASVVRDFSWDQRTNAIGGTVRRVPDGIYSVLTSYASVGVAGAGSAPVFIKISN